MSPFLNTLCCVAIVLWAQQAAPLRRLPAAEAAHTEEDVDFWQLEGRHTLTAFIYLWVVGAYCHKPQRSVRAAPNLHTLSSPLMGLRSRCGTLRMADVFRAGGPPTECGWVYRLTFLVI